MRQARKAIPAQIPAGKAPIRIKWVVPVVLLVVAAAASAPAVWRWNVNRTMFNALKQKSLSALKSALKNGANVNAWVDGPARKPTPAVYFHNALRWPLSKPRTPRATPLMLAVIANNKAQAKLLLQHGALVNTQDEYGFSALIMAISRMNPRITHLLLAYGANPNLENDMHMPALSWALLMGDNRSALELLQAGANVNATDYDHRSPLYLAALENNITLARALIHYGANANTSFHSFSALHIAVVQHNAAMARLLLNAGAVRTDGAALTRLLQAKTHLIVQK